MYNESMNICVLSGSPKGKDSVTFQTVLYLEKKFPQDHFETLHVGKHLRQYEQDFSSAAESLSKADLILFCYPVYTFIVPSQLHRFVELIFENKVDLKGKFAAQITTSKHFYDTTAHQFIADNCKDIGLSYAGGLSADMEDLLSKKGQKQAVEFWNLVHYRAEKPSWDTENSGAHKDYSVCIVTDLLPEDTALSSLIDSFKSAFPGTSKVVNLREIRIDGGCLGCFNCALSGKCLYKDGFDEFLRKEIQTCSSIVYAFSIKNHSMGSLFKKYDDRQFCNGHRTVTMGMPMAYLVNGDLEKEPNLLTIIEGRAQVGGNFLAGIAGSSEEAKSLANDLVYALDNKIDQPSNFLGVGGMKIFRDLIWVMGGLMEADYAFYKKHGFFDFPQKQWKRKIGMKLVGKLVNSPSVKKKMGNAMTEGMLRPYKKIMEETSPEK